MRRLIRLPEVCRRTTHKPSEIYKLMRLGMFPLSVKVGLRKVAWAEDEIDAYIESKLADRKPLEARR